MYTDRVGVGPRALAVILDGLILLPLSCCALVLLSVIDATNTDPVGLLINLVTSVAGFAYYIVLEARSGQTLGKRILKIKVVKEDNSPITMSDSAVRNLLRIVDILPLLAPYLLGAVLIWTNPAKQRLGDKVAKTIVVRVDPIGQQAQVEEPPLPRF